MPDQIHCPKCNSTQLTANKQGFSAGKAAAGAMLTGGVGILAGTIGSGKVKITCLNCGHEWKPGEHNKPVQDLNKPLTSGGKIALIFLLICIIAVVVIIVRR